MESLLYNFSIYGFLAIGIWLIGMLVFLLKKNNKILLFSSLLGTLVLLAFIALYWSVIDRPPLRTLAETRMWYAFFLSLIGALVFIRWKQSWIPFFTQAFAALFIIINISNPETYNKSLMPALQSIWFIPHVIVYMLAYSFLAAAFVFALKTLFSPKEKLNLTIIMTDNIVYLGFGFLTLGLLFGALWAKKAWGHYWTWDPKETWAFITWVAYLVYIHYRQQYKRVDKSSAYILIFAFGLLIVCWFGVQYLPSASSSVHTYAY
jgi:ABC-type transport system involved in cytochrome c biogenesis permease subunit